MVISYSDLVMTSRCPNYFTPTFREKIPVPLRIRNFLWQCKSFPAMQNVLTFRKSLLIS